MIRPPCLRPLLVVLPCLLVGCVQVPHAFHAAALWTDAADAPRHLDVPYSEVPRSELPRSEFTGGATKAPNASRQSGAPSEDRAAVSHAGATSNPRAAGSNVLTTDVFYGVPILQKSFFWDGNGEVDNSGIGVHWLHYLADGVAIGPGLNATSWWTPGRDVYSAELEALLRIHPIDSLPIFIDGTTGFQLANHHIPPGGTVWNYTFGFGFGTELPVADRTWFQAGAFYHHISNALGRQNDRNPSQNEVRFWVGFAFDL